MRIHMHSKSMPIVACIGSGSGEARSSGELPPGNSRRFCPCQESARGTGHCTGQQKGTVEKAADSSLLRNSGTAFNRRTLPLGSVLRFGLKFRSGWVQWAGKFHGTEDVDYAFEVVSHDGEADFGLCAAGSSQQQSGMAKDTVFENREGKLDGRSSEPHRLRGSALVHAIQRIFIQQPSEDTS